MSISFLSGYRLMWMTVMFDLPTYTREERKEAHDFRNFLQDNGFGMVQFSVYMKSCTGKEHCERLTTLIKNNLPQSGKIDILFFTDKQYENIVTLRCKKKCIKRKNPEQFILFQPDIMTFLSENVED